MTEFGDQRRDRSEAAGATGELAWPRVPRRVVADMGQVLSRGRVELEATRDEHARFARNLHDGILQALAGAAFQLEAASRLVGGDPDAARARIKAASELIAAEQRELRSLIQTLRPAGGASLASASEVAAALEKLRARNARQWGLRVELGVVGSGRIPRAMADEICYIVREGLTNVGRHAHARVARVNISIESRRVAIIVADDGCGFPIRGRYDLVALNERRQGPISLRERVTSLHGTLVLASSLSGSCLEISLPVHVHTQAQFPKRTVAERSRRSWEA